MDEDVQIHVSTKFFPNSPVLGRIEPDLVLVSSDSVFFYVHEGVVSGRSGNGFGGILGCMKGGVQDQQVEKAGFGSMNLGSADTAMEVENTSSMLSNPPPMQQWGNSWSSGSGSDISGFAAEFMAESQKLESLGWLNLSSPSASGESQSLFTPPAFNLPASTTTTTNPNPSSPNPAPRPFTLTLPKFPRDRLGVPVTLREPLAIPSPGTPDPRTRNDTNARVFVLEEDSNILNVLLHTLYGLDCSGYSPTLETLFECVRCLGKYGFEIGKFVSRPDPKTITNTTIAIQGIDVGVGHVEGGSAGAEAVEPSLFDLILAYAPERPMDVYTFAAANGFEELAVETSRYLLSYSLSDLTDGPCLQMGSVYLKRLFFLHLGRMEALKRLLASPPNAHSVPSPASASSFSARSTSACTAEQQNKLSLAWAQAVSQLTQEAKPDITAGSIESAFMPLGDQVWCEVCRRGLMERVGEVCRDWSNIKETI